MAARHTCTCISHIHTLLMCCSRPRSFHYGQVCHIAGYLPFGFSNNDAEYTALAEGVRVGGGVYYIDSIRLFSFHNLARA
jgi:hypothetical protein